ncbi:MAG: hypothetical protein GBAus27B_000550 [Mycoplasmataceae bacterium]|nr:MAG: hypothetical protein GBAus27B_000550 [Mycoplasmataceae bacterium]
MVGKIISQKEIIANLSPKLKDELAKIERQEKEEQKLSQQEVLIKYQNWQEYEDKLDKSAIHYLDIGDWHTSHNLSRTDSLQGELIIEDYPNLTQLDVGYCNLRKLTIKNCPKLLESYAGANKLEEVDIDCNSLNIFEFKS